MSSGQPRPHRPARRGMSLPELLMALSISAGLLVAVGVAFNASSQAATQTEQYHRSLQTARQAVNRIVGDIRRCQAVVVGSDELIVTTPTAAEVQYAFDRSVNSLLYRVPQPAPAEPQIVTLARDVTDVRFATNGTSVTLLVTVQVGSNSVTLSGSAMPRRAVSYH